MKRNFNSLLSMSLFAISALSVSACGTGHFGRAASAAPLKSSGIATALDGRWQSACDPITAIMITWDFAGANFRQTSEGYALGTNCANDPTTSTVEEGTFSISNSSYSNPMTGQGGYSSLNMNVDGTSESAAFVLNGSDLQISTQSQTMNPNVMNMMDFVRITDGS